WNLRPWYAVDGSAIDGKRPFDQSNVPESTTAPAIVVPLPARNFVAEWTIRSAPTSSGRQRYGVAKVLSTTSGAPTSCATAAGGSVSGTWRAGWGVAAAKRALVAAVTERRQPPGSSMSTQSRVI